MYEFNNVVEFVNGIHAFSSNVYEFVNVTNMYLSRTDMLLLIKSLGTVVKSLEKSWLRKSTYTTHTDIYIYLYVCDRSILYRSTYASHTDRSICKCVIDLSHIGLPILHIQIDLSVRAR